MISPNKCSAVNVFQELCVEGHKDHSFFHGALFYSFGLEENLGKSSDFSVGYFYIGLSEASLEGMPILGQSFASPRIEKRLAFCGYSSMELSTSSNSNSWQFAPTNNLLTDFFLTHFRSHVSGYSGIR